MCCCDYADNMIEDFAIQFQFNYFGGNRSTQSWIYGCVVPKPILFQKEKPYHNHIRIGLHIGLSKKERKLFNITSLIKNIILSLLSRY